MEIDSVLLSVQRVLKIRTTFEDFDPESDQDLLYDIVKSIKTTCTFLQEKNNEDARRVHFLLFLNTDFEISKYYNENDELFHIFGVIPTLNPIFYFLLINKLNLNEYFSELLFYSSEVISDYLLEVLNKNIKHYDVYDTLNLYEHVMNVIYFKLKYIEMEYNQLNADPEQNDLKQITKIKYYKYLENFKMFGFEFCNNLLNNIKVKSFTRTQSVIFEGLMLLSHIKILLFCTNVEWFENNGQNPKYGSESIIILNKNTEEFYANLNINLVDFDYVNQWSKLIESYLSNDKEDINLCSDCYGYILYDVIKVLTPINTNSWLMFHEHDYKDDKSLQTEIGENAYYVNELLKKVLEKGCDNTQIKQITEEYLPHLCIKPETEDELLTKLLAEEFLPLFNENSGKIKTRSKWLNASLRFFNTKFNAEVLDIMESNLKDLTCEVVFCLQDVIIERLLNDEIELSEDERLRLKTLLINCVTDGSLSLNDQLKVTTTLVEKYKDEELNAVYGADEDDNQTAWLNQINSNMDKTNTSINDICTESLKYIIKKPKETLTRLLNLSLKCKIDSQPLLIKLLTDKLLPHFGQINFTPNEEGDCFILEYFINVLNKIKENYKKEEFSERQDVSQNENNSDLAASDFANVVPLLDLFRKNNVISFEDLFEKYLKEEFFKTDSQLQYLGFILSILEIYFEHNSSTWKSCLDRCIELTHTLAAHLSRTEWNLDTYSREKYSARLGLVKLIQLLIQNEILKNPNDLIETNRCWNSLKLIFDSSSELSQLYHLGENQVTPFLCQMLIRLSLEEWKALVSRMSTESYLDLLKAMQILSQVVESRADLTCYVSCFHQALMNFVVVLKDYIFQNVLKFKQSLSLEYKMDFLESLIFILAHLNHDNLESVRTFYTLNIENTLDQYLEQLFTLKENNTICKQLLVMFTLINNINTRIKLTNNVNKFINVN